MLRTLQTRCSIIASANPKGVYDNEDPLTINTALSSPLLSRFDLILLTLDTPNPEWDNIAATFIIEGIDLLGWSFGLFSEENIHRWLFLFDRSWSFEKTMVNRKNAGLFYDN
jgi:DNA helicase MCM9